MDYVLIFFFKYIYNLKNVITFKYENEIIYNQFIHC